MKPVPIADYLDHIGRPPAEKASPRREASPFRPRSLQGLHSPEPRSPPAFDRAAKAVGAVKAEAPEKPPRPLWDRRPAPVDAGQRELLAAREAAKVEEMALRLEEMRGLGREEGMALGRAEAEERFAAERAEWQEQAVRDRLEFQLNEYARLEATMRAGFAEVEARVGDAVARILAPFLVKEVVATPPTSSSRPSRGSPPAARTGLDHHSRPGAATEPPARTDRRSAGRSRIRRGRRRRGDRRVQRHPDRDRAQAPGPTCSLRSTLSARNERTHPEIVIVRRRSIRTRKSHHGGAWKIAFADFMTAMMAFFLVLWIISATDKNTKTLIARYFNPVKVEEPARSQKGIQARRSRTPSTRRTRNSRRPNGEKSALRPGRISRGNCPIARGHRATTQGSQG